VRTSENAIGVTKSRAIVRVAVLQSNYVPWKGYFDLMRSVDVFVVYDVVQYTKNDWRNRNRVKSANGLVWLTIPVAQVGSFGQRVLDAEIVPGPWAEKHLKTLLQAYARAPHLDDLRAELGALYETAAGMNLLHDVNMLFMDAARRWLGIETRLVQAQDFSLPDDRNERLLALCSTLGASTYVSGPTARSYLDEAAFAAGGTRVEWFDYQGYEAYPQLHGEFVHEVSVLDLVLNTGPDAGRYLDRHDDRS
jgi:hypothetical protein